MCILKPLNSWKCNMFWSYQYGVQFSVINMLKGKKNDAVKLLSNIR